MHWTQYPVNFTFFSKYLTSIQLSFRLNKMYVTVIRYRIGYPIDLSIRHHHKGVFNGVPVPFFSFSNPVITSWQKPFLGLGKPGIFIESELKWSINVHLPCSFSAYLTTDTAPPTSCPLCPKSTLWVGFFATKAPVF